jgi:hypothetical protein
MQDKRAERRAVQSRGAGGDSDGCSEEVIGSLIMSPNRGPLLLPEQEQLAIEAVTKEWYPVLSERPVEELARVLS